MSYKEAMEAAGAKVLSFREFGNYQGDWFARIEVAGRVGWTSGSFGSCSSCDSFQAEFGWDDECDADYQERLKSFGAPYLVMQDEAAILELLDKQAKWDDQSREAGDWIRAGAPA